MVEYTTIPWEEAKFEAHENYTDIQYMIKGTELMSYAPIDQLTVKTPYNPDKDVIFYTNDVPGVQVAVNGRGVHDFQSLGRATSRRLRRENPCQSRKLLLR